MGQLRIFKKYRLLLEYIRQSMYEVVPFLLVAFVMILGYTLAYCYKDSVGVDFVTLNSFKKHFDSQYRALHGNFSEDIVPHNDMFDFAMFFSLTMLQPLILMNLLIAIIAVAHNRIEDNKLRVSYHQLNFLILENELFMPWNRTKNERGHLVTAQYENEDSVRWRPLNEESNLDEKIKGIE
jgi:hypothetical protein